MSGRPASSRGALCVEIVALRHVFEYYPPVMSFVSLVVCVFAGLLLPPPPSLSLFIHFFFTFLFFSSPPLPDHFWGPHSLLSVPPKECVELYLHSHTLFSFDGCALEEFYFFLHVPVSHFCYSSFMQGSPDSLIGVLNGLRAGRCGVRIPVEAREFSLLQNV